MRIAVGAGRSSVVALVLREGMTWAGCGVVLGLLGAWSFGKAIGALLFDVTATDPLTFGVTASMAVTMAALACLVPAVRATVRAFSTTAARRTCTHARLFGAPIDTFTRADIIPGKEAKCKAIQRLDARWRSCGN